MSQSQAPCPVHGFLSTGVQALLEQARAVGLSPAEAATAIHLAVINWSIDQKASDETVARLAQSCTTL